MREDIKIDGIPIQDYGTPNSRSCYPGEIQIGETIKSNIDYWRNKYLEENDKNNNLIKQLQKQNAEIENIADQLRQEKENTKYWKDRYKNEVENEAILIEHISVLAETMGLEKDAPIDEMIETFNKEKYVQKQSKI